VGFYAAKRGQTSTNIRTFRNIQKKKWGSHLDRGGGLTPRPVICRANFFFLEKIDRFGHGGKFKYQIVIL